MKYETLGKILAFVQNEDDAKEALDMLSCYEDKYEENADGTVVKLRIFKGANGNTVTEICNSLKYRDITKMTLEELEEYYTELEEQHDEAQEEAPENEDSEEYEQWEDRIAEFEDELDAVFCKIEELKKN